MLISDFQNYKILNFAKEEIEKTGANIQDVNVFLISSLQTLRKSINYPIYLLNNGLTTGQHASFQHKNGTAVDIVFSNDYNIDDKEIKRIYFTALQCGFRGIGVYWNGKVFSFHLDLGLKYRSWLWHKRDIKERWQKTNLFKNPKIFLGG